MCAEKCLLLLGLFSYPAFLGTFVTRRTFQSDFILRTRISVVKLFAVFSADDNDEATVTLIHCIS